MTLYEWVCRDCELLWDRDCKMGTAPERTRCPECKKLSPRNFQCNFNFADNGTGNRGTGAMDFHSVRSRYKKFAKNGYDKTSGDRFLKRSIQEVKDRVEGVSEERHYASYNFNMENLARDGKVKKLDAEGAKARLERTKENTKQLYELATKQGKDVDINRRPTQH